MTRRRYDDPWPLVAVLAVVIVVLGLIALVLGARDARACESRGGHIHHLYRSSVCVSPDGRILE